MPVGIPLGPPPPMPAPGPGTDPATRPRVRAGGTGNPAGVRATRVRGPAQRPGYPPYGQGFPPPAPFQQTFPGTEPSAHGDRYLRDAV